MTEHASGTDILMVASLRRFKGVYEFAALAERLPQYRFVLVVSATERQVGQFIHEIGVLPNLCVYSQQTDLHPFYRQAKLLLQLSRAGRVYRNLRTDDSRSDDLWPSRNRAQCRRTSGVDR